MMLSAKILVVSSELRKASQGPSKLVAEMTGTTPKESGSSC